MIQYIRRVETEQKQKLSVLIAIKPDMFEESEIEQYNQCVKNKKLTIPLVTVAFLLTSIFKWRMYFQKFSIGTSITILLSMYAPAFYNYQKCDIREARLLEDLYIKYKRKHADLDQLRDSI